MTRDELVKKLIAQAEGLELMAEADEAVAAHFKPRYDACWSGGGPGDGKLVDTDTAYKLKYYAVDKVLDAKRQCREASELREAVLRIAGVEP